MVIPGRKLRFVCSVQRKRTFVKLDENRESIRDSSVTLLYGIEEYGTRGSA